MKEREYGEGAPFRTLYWDEEGLVLLDQTRLPVEVQYERQESLEQVWDSIKKLKVRGAPALGVAGAYGLLYGVRQLMGGSRHDFISALKKSAAYLNTSRPTAVNLSWALRRMVARAEAAEEASAGELYDLLLEEARRIHREDQEICRGIGRSGRDLIREGMGILTHCNAGALATSGIGTATAPLYTAHREGLAFRVFADETRPLLQGARLTSWELKQAGLDVTLICDNMAASMMNSGGIDLVLVGCDRVAANGDAANKIGTLGVAVMARHFGIPFYVACPSSTIDFETPRGEDIVIEERDPEEVRFFGERRTGPEDVSVRNPAFDVTPHQMITGLITEKGIISPPFDTNMKALFGS